MRIDRLDVQRRLVVGAEMRNRSGAIGRVADRWNTDAGTRLAVDWVSVKGRATRLHDVSVEGVANGIDAFVRTGEYHAALDAAKLQLSTKRREKRAASKSTKTALSEPSGPHPFEPELNGIGHEEPDPEDVSGELVNVELTLEEKLQRLDDYTRDWVDDLDHRLARIEGSVLKYLLKLIRESDANGSAEEFFEEKGGLRA